MFKKRLRNRGLSLAEAGLVLALGMLASVIALGFYSSASKNIDIKGDVDSTLVLMSRIKRAFASAPSYTGLDMDFVVNGEMLPEGWGSMDPGVGTIGMTPSGWWVSLGGPPGITDGRAFLLGLSNVPQSSCQAIVTSIAAAGYTVGVRDSGGGIVPIYSVGGSLDMNALASGCRLINNTDPIPTTGIGILSDGVLP